MRYKVQVNSFRDFYSRERHRFFAYLIRRAGDYALACDILQESFTRLCERYGPQAFTPQLLYTIGRNLVLDSLRRRKNSPTALGNIDLPDKAPERHLMVREEYRCVLAAMRHLEEDERDLLSLVATSGLSYREIARVAGTSEANVKVKVHRARKKLRTLLGDS